MNIITLLQNVLGHGKVMANNEMAFRCPCCHHHKPKLQLNTISQKWQCWVCGVKGRSIYILLKKAGAAKEILDDVAEELGKPTQHQVSKSYDTLTMPPAMITFLNGVPIDPDFKNAYHYLTQRNLTRHDILKYNIGYCDKGAYQGMIVIPSYDEKGSLNFFTARSFYPDVTFKHKNPQVSKDIIGFDMLINWDEPITLVEGAFDAIAVKRNAIPLFGKKVLDKLKTKIVKKGVKHINIALDEDAILNALSICEYFMSNGIKIKLIEMKDKDPSELGFEKITELINKTEFLTSSALMRKKVMRGFM